jgi:hypothetical protein
MARARVEAGKAPCSRDPKVLCRDPPLLLLLLLFTLLVLLLLLLLVVLLLDAGDASSADR